MFEVKERLSHSQTRGTLWAGVRIVAGTDGAGLGTMLPGFGLQHELQLLVESGLTPLQAIQAATINAAAALRKEHDLGGVEPGYFADSRPAQGHRQHTKA